MRILSFETATYFGGVGYAAPGVRDGAGPFPPRGASREILAAAKGLLETHGCGVEDLDAVAVSTGPGLFTGVRVGLSIAKTLAWAQGERGTTALAGYNVTTRILGLGMIASMGLGGVAPALVGQNLGAQKPERAERSAWVVAGAAMALAALLLIPLAYLAPHVIPLFNTEADVIAAGTHCLRIMAWGQVIAALAMTISMSLRGAGDTISPMWISTGALWLVQIPLAYGLPRVTGWGVTGLWVALTVTPIVTALAISLRFRQGRWKLRRI